MTGPCAALPNGRIKSILPLSALDTFAGGFTKPVQRIVFAIALLAVSAIGAFQGMSTTLLVVLPAIALLCLIRYFRRKCLLLSFTTNGGNDVYFLSKRSVIEGLAVDESLANRIGDIVQRNYIAQTRR